MLRAIKDFFTHTDHNVRSDRWIFATILIFSVFSLIVSLILSIEKIHLLQDPSAQLSCSFNVIFNCASVMQTAQASILGFPNSFIGLMAEAVFVTLAVGWLAGARYHSWFMQGAIAGSLIAFLFAQWLFFQSVYVIGILCPWCLVVTVSSTIVLAAFLRYGLRENLFYLPSKTHQKVLSLLKKDYDKFAFAIWLIILVILVFIQFPDIFG